MLPILRMWLLPVLPPVQHAHIPIGDIRIFPCAQKSCNRLAAQGYVNCCKYCSPSSGMNHSSRCEPRENFINIALGQKRRDMAFLEYLSFALIQLQDECLCCFFSVLFSSPENMEDDYALTLFIVVLIIMTWLALYGTSPH